MTGEHYFSGTPESDQNLRVLEVVLAGRVRSLMTASGVFSSDRIDPGTSVLLAEVPPPPRDGDLLDVGCGWGPIALTLALRSPDATVWAVDVNQRALDLTRRNAELLDLTNVNAVLPEDVPSDLDVRTIWSNPPIRIGKPELHSLLERWVPRLSPASDAWLVVQRNLGSDSLQRWLETVLSDDMSVSREATGKGYRVLRVRRR